MTCSISVDWSNTYGIRKGGVIQNLHVEGSATDCLMVDVTVTCGGVALAKQQAQVGYPPNSPAGTKGTWIAQLFNLPSVCDCGKSIAVFAACSDTPETCHNLDHDQFKDLICIDVPDSVPACPGVVWGSVDDGDDCDANGNRKVTVAATVTGAGIAAAELRDQQNALLASQSVPKSPPFTLQGFKSYPGGTTQVFRVVFLSPAGCVEHMTPPYAIPSCAAGEMPGGSGHWGHVAGDCPPVSWHQKIGRCDANGNREVKVKATLGGAGLVTAELRDSQNALLDSKNQAAPYDLQGAETYPGGTTQEFRVVVTQPKRCGDAKFTVDLGECGSGSSASSGNSCPQFVWIIGGLLALAASLTAVGALLAVCAPTSVVVPAWLWPTIGALYLVVGALIAVWFAVCNLWPSCKCPTACDWLQIGTMSAIAVAIMVFWLGSCCATDWLYWVFGSAYLASAIAWTAACKPSFCTWNAAHLVAIVSGALPATGYILIFLPQAALCASGVVLTAAETVAAISAALAGACVGMRARSNRP